MSLFLALSFLVTVVSANVIPYLPSADLEGRITNGNEARPGQFPYTCALTSSSSVCGAVLISNEWVLTAAHCVKGATDVSIIMGAHNIRNQDEEGRIKVSVPQENLFVHEKWNASTLQNDIALVKLPERVELNDRIQPASLPKYSDVNNTFEGKRVVAAGWGQQSDSDPSISTTLHYVEVYVMNQQKCARTYYGLVNDNHICISTEGGTSTCSGDSGGPLVYRDNDTNVLLGLTSFGVYLGCEAGYPAVFTRVSGFLDWIDAKTGLVKP